MSIFKAIVKIHPDMFVHMKSDVVHPHDHFMAWTFLRLIPSFVTPNMVTMFRLLATPIVFWFILLENYQVGVLAFVMVAFTDAIDGSLARMRAQVTKFGMVFDPLADKILIGSMVILVVFQNFNIVFGIAIILIELTFIVSAIVYRLKKRTIRGANLWGKIKMILQTGAISLTLIALLLDFPLLLSIAAGFLGLAIGFALLSLFSHGI
jgi:CDP-diacylglycerol--glycerol-3-phosphate 3-phosphatidyltransferase